MKKIVIAICCLAAMTLNSCFIEDVKDESLSSQEISQCLQAVKGNYTGKILFENHNPNDYSDIVDTLDISWRITADTLIVFDQFPQTIVLDRISEASVKEALQAAAPAPLKSQFAFYKADPISFLLYPYSVVYNIELNGEAHKAVLAFYVNTYSYGLFESISRVFQMKFQIAGLYLDENANHNYLTNSAYDNTSIPIILTNSDLK